MGLVSGVYPELVEGFTLSLSKGGDISCCHRFYRFPGFINFTGFNGFTGQLGLP